MGIFDAFGCGIGISQQQAQQQMPSWYLAGMQPQQHMMNMQQYLNPFDYQRYVYESMRPQQPYQPPIKHVDSVDVTPRERARKQINGAVQAVKDAQIAAKTK